MPIKKMVKTYKAGRARQTEASRLAKQIMNLKYKGQTLKKVLGAGEYTRIKNKLIKGTFDPKTLRKYRKK